MLKEKLPAEWRTNVLLLKNYFLCIKMNLHCHLEEIFCITDRIVDIRYEQCCYGSFIT